MICIHTNSYYKKPLNLCKSNTKATEIKLTRVRKIPLTEACMIQARKWVSTACTCIAQYMVMIKCSGFHKHASLPFSWTQALEDCEVYKVHIRN